jgi:hypothetical protein
VTYAYDEIQTVLNRPLAYHEAIASLVKEHHRSYDDAPRTVAIHPDQVSEPDERAIVMVRDGTLRSDSSMRIRQQTTHVELSRGMWRASIGTKRGRSRLTPHWRARRHPHQLMRVTGPKA